MHAMSTAELRQYAILNHPDELRDLIKNSCGLPVGEYWHLIDNRHEIHRQCVTLYQTSSGWLTGIAAWKGPIFDKISSDDHRYLVELNNIADGFDSFFRIYLFPLDPMMPDLKAAMAPGTYAAGSIWQHNRTLNDDDADDHGFRGPGAANHINIIPVRYRPCMSCTIQVSIKIHKQNERVFFSKVYTSEKLLYRVYKVMQRLYLQQKKANSIYFARPSEIIPNKKILIQASMPGKNLEKLLTAALTGKISNLERTCCALKNCGKAIQLAHACKIHIDKKRSLLSELNELEGKACDIKDVNNQIGTELLELSTLLRKTYLFDNDEQHYVLTHGDFKPGQVLVDGTDIRVLDFDNAALSDPVFDLGTFIATLKQYLIKSLSTATANTAQLNKQMTEKFMLSFCQGYYQQVRMPADKIMWCVSLALFRKAIREFYKDHDSDLVQLQIAEAVTSLQKRSPYWINKDGKRLEKIIPLKQV